MRNTDKIIRKTEENAVLLERTITAKSVHWYFFFFFAKTSVSLRRLYKNDRLTKKKINECFKVEPKNPNWKNFPH